MNIFEQYGLKEVANVTFYDISTGLPVLFLDTLKVSTIETTADNVDANGGWGNPALITWDFNKEVNVTLTDALFSAKSLQLSMGADIKEASSSDKETIDYNESLTVADGKVTLSYDPKTNTEVYYLDKSSGKYTKGTVTSKSLTVSGYSDGDQIQVFYKIEVDGQKSSASVITISASKFGGTYRVVGDTVVRSKETGEDEPFQFVIEKAKVNSDVTFTMEAEGDPATFDLTLKVLKDSNSNMFKLIKYNLSGAASVNEDEENID
jgi:hypothetical protein